MHRLLWLPLLLAIGCGGNPVGKVTGLVTMDDKPLAHTDVTFWPKDDPALGTYGTRTKADGRFELFQDPRPGAYIKPGRYVAVVAKVTAAPKEEEPAAVAATGKNPLPPVYDDQDKSPLIVDVKPGDNDFELKLKSKP